MRKEDLAKELKLRGITKEQWEDFKKGYLYR
jgi:hypothetical protein